ncbi:hypothetical protein [Nocardia sp.]|uniref:hypothetical protein n=1 Tax=Nocardia sp. TaxID=1821 RepID=UPI00261B366E|nr:hypothetical protein [Nocardia sp.]
MGGKTIALEQNPRTISELRECAEVAAEAIAVNIVRQQQRSPAPALVKGAENMPARVDVKSIWFPGGRAGRLKR